MKSIIGLLNEIIRMLGGLFAGQEAIQSHLTAQDEAIEHLRVLLEGEEPTVTGIEVQEGTH